MSACNYQQQLFQLHHTPKPGLPSLPPTLTNSLPPTHSPSLPPSLVNFNFELLPAGRLQSDVVPASRGPPRCVATVAAVAGRVPVVVHVGATGSTETVQCLRHQFDLFFFARFHQRRLLQCSYYGAVRAAWSTSRCPAHYCLLICCCIRIR